ncbi:MAG: hypothetical protein HQL95_00400 [Magnetococcales bacterium]|nr:hypothetical protein [Magnetococcales bacterium]
MKTGEISRTLRNPSDAGTLQEVVAIVERVEALAWTEEWRDAAREMRVLRERWQVLEGQLPDWDRELTTRFRAAQQTFMDRRADYYQRGNVRKGTGLMERLEKKQADVVRIKEELQGYYDSLADFETRMNATPLEGHGVAIRAFIGESIAALQEEIGRKEGELDRLERTIPEISSRYYCVE